MDCGQEKGKSEHWAAAVTPSAAAHRTPCANTGFHTTVRRLSLALRQQPPETTLRLRLREAQSASADQQRHLKVEQQ